MDDKLAVQNNTPSTKQVVIRNPSVNAIIPKNFDEVTKFSEAIAKSKMCPPAFRNDPDSCKVAVLHGLEIGLKPMQAIQGIAVISGKPSVWGDTMVALARAHPDFEWIKESFEGDEDQDTLAAFCEIKRRGCDSVMVIFAIADAKKAGLWGKQGPWTQYPRRMLQMRARSWAIRDNFQDALMGMYNADEMQDVPSDIIDITPVPEEEIGKVELARKEITNYTAKRKRDWWEKFENKLKENSTDSEFAEIQAMIPPGPGRPPIKKTEEEPPDNVEIPAALSTHGKALFPAYLDAKHYGEEALRDWLNDNAMAVENLPEDDRGYFASGK